MYYEGQQVNVSGAVHTGKGVTDAGPYHFATMSSPYQFNTDTPPPGEYYHQGEYSKSGANPTGIIPPAGLSTVDPQTFAGGINAGGTAVGWADTGPGIAMGYTSTRDHTAFVYRPGGPTRPGDMPGLSAIPGAYANTYASYALGINSAGMIVGATPGPDGFGSDYRFGRAMLSDGTTTVDLNTLIAPGSGLLLTSATSINDLGQIAGYATDLADRTIHAYLLTPTPEPGAWAVAAAMMTGFGLRRLTKNIMMKSNV